jgi:hypothetical protein
MDQHRRATVRRSADAGFTRLSTPLVACASEPIRNPDSRPLNLLWVEGQPCTLCARGGAAPPRQCMTGAHTASRGVHPRKMRRLYRRELLIIHHTPRTLPRAAGQNLDFNFFLVTPAQIPRKTTRVTKERVGVEFSRLDFVSPI